MLPAADSLLAYVGDLVLRGGLQAIVAKVSGSGRDDCSPCPAGPQLNFTEVLEACDKRCPPCRLEVHILLLVFSCGFLAFAVGVAVGFCIFGRSRPRKGVIRKSTIKGGAAVFEEF